VDEGDEGVAGSSELSSEQPSSPAQATVAIAKTTRLDMFDLNPLSASQHDAFSTL
jgi:hypothetical protein